MRSIRGSTTGLLLLAMFGAAIPLHAQQPTPERAQSILVNRPDLNGAIRQRIAESKLTAEQIKTKDLAGEKIQAILTNAPGNNAAIGGLKVVAESGWFAARPSGTEDIYKIYAESFRGADHLKRIQDEAQTIVSDALHNAGHKE